MADWKGENEENLGASGGTALELERQTSGGAQPCIISSTQHTDLTIESGSGSVIFVEGIKQTINNFETKTPGQVIIVDSESDIKSKRIKPNRSSANMADWTSDDVRLWLITDCGIRDNLAEKIFKERVDGKALQMYTANELKRDFDLRESELQSIQQSRNVCLQQEHTSNVEHPTGTGPFHFHAHASSSISQQDDNSKMTSPARDPAGETSSVGRDAMEQKQPAQLAISATANYKIRIGEMKDSIIFIHTIEQKVGQPSADMPVTMDVQAVQEGAESHTVMNCVFTMLKKCVQLVGLPIIKAMVAAIEHNDDGKLQEMKLGTIHFVVRFHSREALDRFRERCLNGELAKTLTELLITDEIKQLAGGERSITLNIKDSDYEQACKILDEGQIKRDLPSRMADWTNDDVKLWLVQIGLQESIANRFHEVDGTALQQLTEEDLLSRFDLRKGEMRNILYSKVARLEKEQVAPPEPSVGQAVAGASSSTSETSFGQTVTGATSTLQDMPTSSTGEVRVAQTAAAESSHLQGTSSAGDKKTRVWSVHLQQFINLQRLELRNCSLSGDGLNKIANSVVQLPDLTELNVAGNKALRGSAGKWASYLRTMKKLRKIDLSACSLTGQDVKAVAVRIRDKLEVQLNLSANEELGDSTELWAKSLNRIKKLDQLDLSDCLLKGSSMEEVIGGGLNLVDLNLSENGDLGGSLESWAKLLQRMTKLTKLELRECSLKADDLRHVGAALADVASFEELSLAGNTGIGDSAALWSQYLVGLKHLKKLDLSACSLTGEDLQYIAPVLSVDISLVEFNISNNKDIGISSALWSHHLRCMKPLKKLDLSECSLTGGCMVEILAGDLDLVELDISGNEALSGTLQSWGEQLPRMKNLQRLNLSACALTSQDVQFMATVLKDKSNFSELGLSGNKDIGESQTAWKLSLGSMDHLQKLDLSDCSLAGKCLNDILDGEINLAEFNISVNEGLGGFGKYWAQKLSQMKRLRKLNLGSCALISEDLGPITSALIDNPDFNELCLSGNNAISESPDSWSIIWGLKEMSKLDLSECSLKESCVGHLTKGKLSLKELTLSGNEDLGVSLG